MLDKPRATLKSGLMVVSLEVPGLGSDRLVGNKVAIDRTSISRRMGRLTNGRTTLRRGTWAIRPAELWLGFFGLRVK